MGPKCIIFDILKQFIFIFIFRIQKNFDFRCIYLNVCLINMNININLRIYDIILTLFNRRVSPNSKRDLRHFSAEFFR